MAREARRKKLKSNKSARARVVPDKVEHVVTSLENIYWNGFIRRATSYRIARSKLRELAGVPRLKIEIVKSIVDQARMNGFILYPLDSSNEAKAQDWIFDAIERFAKYPLVDHYAVQRAEKTAL